MIVPFIPAGILKKKFEVSGHFYSLDVPGVGQLKCRSTLKILSKNAPQDVEADAVFVMMNPGSSRPIGEDNQATNFPNVSERTDPLAPTFPDTTQYQVMRVMHYSGWQHVRVINLSDLCDPKSRSFVKRYAQLERERGVKFHSIFSSGRMAELKRHLIRKANAPIVCAWGVSNQLDPLIKRATKALSEESGIVGLAKSGADDKYFHPLPSLQHKKEKWVAEMLVALLA